MKLKEIEIIKEQIQILKDSGFIFEERKRVFIGLSKGDTFYLEMRGEIK